MSAAVPYLVPTMKLLVDANWHMDGIFAEYKPFSANPEPWLMIELACAEAVKEQGAK